MVYDDREWLETDGQGGFASGTVSGRRTRRYHALLLASVTPPTGRFVLINGLEVQVSTPAGVVPISSQHYAPNVVHPGGDRYIQNFEDDPWPTWIYRLPDGTVIRQELFSHQGVAATTVRWSLLSNNPGRTTLSVRPLISGRDYHALHHENDAFRFDHVSHDPGLTWHPYEGVPPITVVSNAEYAYEPMWYRSFLYSQELERGLDAVEDLASPGIFRFELDHEPAIFLFQATAIPPAELAAGTSLQKYTQRVESQERKRRKQFPSRLHRSADQFIVRRNSGKTIIAGYPWFADWGRDTFIALRGLCLASGQLVRAGQVLDAWTGSISEGMLPNRFPDDEQAPAYNSVDASLWYIISIADYVQAGGRGIPQAEVDRLYAAASSILTAYAEGTRYGIHADHDGLLAAGEAAQQLTWMDAKVGDWVVTPRTGKPVEVQALWINALAFGARLSNRWQKLYEQARDSFEQRFWNNSTGCLFDVIDVDHQPGFNDPTIRPNQIFAVGGLPLNLLDRDRARRVVDLVERRLLTPLGLRSLDPASNSYCPHYQGGVWSRDSAYHQGTAWPWLIGPFVEAWVRVQGATDAAKEQARERFLPALLEHLKVAGIGHLSEIADGEPTPGPAGAVQIPRGCPFQAWSLSELLRLLEVVLRPEINPQLSDTQEMLPRQSADSL
jgi:predicted glycogen debranching enzyme